MVFQNLSQEYWWMYSVNTNLLLCIMFPGFIYQMVRQPSDMPAILLKELCWVDTAWRRGSVRASHPAVTGSKRDTLAIGILSEVF